MKRQTILFCVLLAVLLYSATPNDILLCSEPSTHLLGDVKPQYPITADDLGHVPIQFIPNQGQMDSQVAYYVQGRDKTIYFADDGLTFLMASSAQGGNRADLGIHDYYNSASSRRWVVKLDFLDSSSDRGPKGLSKSGGVVSYFRGAPDKWRSGLSTYSRIAYQELWPGIDLVYDGTFNRLKYQFIVHPGADPATIKLAYRGIKGMEIDTQGRLVIRTETAQLQDDVPIAYQEISGKRILVPVSYDLDKGAEDAQMRPILDNALGDPISQRNLGMHPYGFRVAEYDHEVPLVIDPAILVYCGYVAGPGDEIGNGIAVDGSGNVYITGETQSVEPTFPVAVGPDVTYNGGYRDAFVAKINASGTGLAYCGYIGGYGNDTGTAIDIDNLGNAYITGAADAYDFPAIVGPDITHNGVHDVFVAKVNPSGTALDYCGFIGGSNVDLPWGVAVDDAGGCYVTGYTWSNEATFPVTIGPDLSFNGGQEDAFVAKVFPSGAGLAYCGYLGGSDSDSGSAIAVDSAGNAYVTGSTYSTETSFPIKGGPDLTQNGNDDVFIAKINPLGSALVYCGYIGCGYNDYGKGIAVDGLGCAYVTGYSGGVQSNFPVIVGPDLTYNGDYNDAFVAKIDPSGASLIYCGYIGGSGNDWGNGIALDGDGNAYITGFTESTESTFPVFGGPDLTHNGGYGDAFIAKVNASGSALSYCGYIGGTGDEEGRGIAIDGIGNAYISGVTTSTEATLPTTTGPDLTYNGGSDAFVAKIRVRPPTLTSLSPSNATGGDPGLTLSVVGSDFLNGGVVRWDGNDRPTTFINDFELDAQIGTSDLSAGRVVQVSVLNPDGGSSNSLEFSVSSFSLGSSPTGNTVTAGQAATYAIQVSPLYGPFNSSISFGCVGLPGKCTASFSPTNVTPGANAVTTTLTLSTQSTSTSVGGVMSIWRNMATPASGTLLAVIVLLFSITDFRKLTRESLRRRLLAGIVVCVIIMIASCSAGGDDNNPPYTGTPKGTHQITVQGTSGGLTASTTITLVVR